MSLQLLDYVSVDAGKYKGRIGWIIRFYRNSRNGVRYVTIESTEVDTSFIPPRKFSVYFDVRFERLSPTTIDGKTRASDILRQPKVEQ